MTSSFNLRVPILCCLAAVAALSLGSRAELALRAAVRDAARPGFSARLWLASRREQLDLRRWPWTAADAKPTHSAVAVADQADDVELRRLRAELATTRRRLGRLEASLGPIVPTVTGDSHVERIPARLLRGADDEAAPGGLILAAGAAAGIETDRPVIRLTAGSERGVATGDDVLAGAAVVGRTAEVGGWTSRVVTVTDPAFRAHVWIVRSASGGPDFSEEGVLEGDGRGGCTVKYVPSTAAVAPGDHVYSRDESGRLTQPLYYGVVRSATLRPAAPHWEIHVAPAAGDTAAGEVHVLKPRALRMAETTR